MRFPLITPTIVIAALAGLAACSSTNKSESKSELEVRAQSGDTDARYQLGTRYADGAFPNKPEAIYWLCLAGREGHVPAQMRLARLYEDQGLGGGGTGKLSNRGSAYFWYTAAASQGDDQAFSRREALEDVMDASEVAEVKRKATRWQQAGCLRPS
jgi:TPR repeat protein